MTSRTVDIIIPVHRDARTARRCLRSVLAPGNATPHAVIIVTQGDIAGDIAAMDEAKDDRVTVLREARGLDYAGMVNRAFALHEDRDVVVLQADAEVAGDWLDRLAVHATAGVAVAGTFTNVAGAVTYPRANASNALPDGGTTAALDALFSNANRGQSAATSVVHGPCLYITRACLTSIGGLKTVATADGHASEIDFGLRAQEAGFEMRVAGDTFVFNDGEGSFGNRYARLRDHAATPTLENLHPRYAELRKEGPEDDRLRMFAGHVDIARLAASSRPVIVFISHAWGGGIRRHMNDLAAFIGERAHVLYLEPAGAGTVRLYWPREGESFAAWFTLPDDLAPLCATLHAIGVARLHFHHVHDLPEAILQLPGDSGIAYDCTLHDYYAICPQYHLADAEGRYCGEPDAAGCARCLGARAAQWNLDIATWRQRLGELLRRAERVIAPSQDVASRIGRYLPDVAIDVWPHPEHLPERAANVVRVAILGNLSREKGLDVVARCAADAMRRGLPLTFRVLGSTTEPIVQSPQLPLTIHGSYDEASLPQLLAGEHADVLFFPAQVPETYSYTLSIALATRTPIVASALGAFIERLAGRAETRLLAWDATPEQWNDALLDAATAGIRDSEPTVARSDVTLGITS